MRTVALGCAMLSIAACNQEPTFDERYDAAKSSISEKAVEIDRDLEEGMDGPKQSIRADGGSRDGAKDTSDQGTGNETR